jgi:alpha-L-fucosidase 2
MRARGGLTIDMAWEKGQLTTLRIGGRPGDAVTLRQQGKVVQVKLDAGGTFRSTGAALRAMA